MGDYTLTEAAERLDEAKAQLARLNAMSSTAAYSNNGKSVTRQQISEQIKLVEWWRSLYNSLAGRTPGRTLARPRSGA